MGVGMRGRYLVLHAGMLMALARVGLPTHHRRRALTPLIGRKFRFIRPSGIRILSGLGRQRHQTKRRLDRGTLEYHDAERENQE